MTTIKTYATRILQVALSRQDVPRTDKADDVAFSDIAGVAQAILDETESGRNKWISVEETLPQKGEIVLATGFEYNNKEGSRFYLVSLFDNGFRHYIQNSESWSKDGSSYITHWKLLPNSPEKTKQTINKEST